MKPTFNKLLLFIAVLCTLGSSKSMAASVCRDYVNSLPCELKLRVKYLHDCNGDGIGDPLIGFFTPSVTIILPPNSTTHWCTPLTMPNPNPGDPNYPYNPCEIIITGYEMENTKTGEVVPISTQGNAFLPYFQFTKGACTNPIYLSENEGNLTISVQAPQDNYCGPFCFTNETKYPLTYSLIIERGRVFCEGELPFSSADPIQSPSVKLKPGERYCFEVTTPRGCKVCPGNLTINLCGEGNKEPCKKMDMTRHFLIINDADGLFRIIYFIYDGNGNYRFVEHF